MESLAIRERRAHEDYTAWCSHLAQFINQGASKRTVESCREEVSRQQARWMKLNEQYNAR